MGRPVWSWPSLEEGGPPVAGTPRTGSARRSSLAGWVVGGGVSGGLPCVQNGPVQRSAGAGWSWPGRRTWSPQAALAAPGNSNGRTSTADVRNASRSSRGQELIAGPPTTSFIPASGGRVVQVYPAYTAPARKGRPLFFLGALTRRRPGVSTSASRGDSPSPKRWGVVPGLGAPSRDEGYYFTEKL